MKLKKILSLSMLFGGIASAIFLVPWIIVKAWIMPLPDTIQEQVDDAVNYDLDGIIVYVDQAGKEPQIYTAGWHNREKRIPARPDALFKIASINKLYVAVAITKLVSSGRLSLEKSVAEYFPELVGKIENVEQIPIRLLVKHRSGIPNFTDTPDFWNNPPANKEEALARVFGLPASFEPDDDYEYSNTNYLLLANLMDKTLGYSHFEYIREEILQPLGLTDTHPSLAGLNMDDVMSCYHIGYKPDLKDVEYGMLATIQDVGVFLRALNDGSIFKEGEQEIYSSIYVYEHTGLVPGSQSFAHYHKEIDAVVVLFNNTSGKYALNVAEVIYNRVVKILTEESRGK